MIVVGQDTTPPVVNGCPEPLNFMVPPGRTSGTLTWTEPTATDNDGMTPTITQSHQPGDSFNVGTTTVSYTFTDLAGNQAQCSFTVAVGNYHCIHLIGG